VINHLSAKISFEKISLVLCNNFGFCPAN